MLTTLQEEMLRDIAKKLLKKGYPLEDIVEITNLSLEEIKNLEKGKK